MRTLIIGDIHGCFRELQMLIEKAGLSARDQIIAVGDLVDRGPCSWKVVQFLRDRKNSLSVLGNHERKHLRWVTGESVATQSQLITRVFERPNYIDMLGYFKTMPLFVETPETIIFHGCFEPGLQVRDQLESVLCGATSGEQYLRRVHDQPWYALYRGRKKLIVGHRDFLGTGQPFIYQDRVFGLDTSCCKGGALTGLLLPEWKFISVKAPTNYWALTLVRRARVK